MRKIIFIFILLSLFRVAFSQTAEPLLKNEILLIDEDTAVSLALANNINLDIQKILFNNDKWALFTSWNTFVPEVSINATLYRSNLDDDDRTVPSGESNLVVQNTPYGPIGVLIPETEISPQWGLSANFNLSLTLHANQIFNIYRTVIDYKSGKLTLEQAKSRLNRDVKINLYRIILQEELINLMKEQLETAKKRYQQAQTLYYNGVVSEYEMLRAQVAYENIKPALLEEENNYNNYVLAYKQMLGLKKEVKVNFKGNITSRKKVFNIDNLIKYSFISNLDLKLLLLNIQEVQNARNMSIATLTPAFSILYNMDPTFQKDPLTDSWSNQDNWKQRSGMFGLQLSMPLSTLFPFSKSQVNIITGQYTVNQLKKSYEQLQQGQESKIESLVRTMEKSVKSIEALKLNIVLAKKAYEQAEAAYAVGSEELLNVQKSENEYKQAEFNLLSEEFKYTANLLELQYLLNTDPESLSGEINEKTE